MTTLIKREHFDFPDLWRRFLEPDADGSWLRVEEFQDGDTMVVRAEIPGIDPDKDVELTISEGVLRVKAHREQTSEQKSREGYRSEFRYGSFVRSVPLPPGTRDEDVKASYNDGILEIRIPVGEVKAATKVPITRS